MAAAITTKFFSANGTDVYDFAGLEARILEALPTSAKDIPISLILVAAIIIGFLATTVREKKPNLSHIPILAPELGSTKARQEFFTKNSREALQRGYRDFKEKPFLVESVDGPRVVISVDHMEEIRAMPDSIVDNRAPINEAIMTQYTEVPFADDVVLRSIKADLSTKLGASPYRTCQRKIETYS